MKVQVKLKLEMAARVRLFSQTHPSDQAEYAKVLAELEERLTRGGTVAGMQSKGSVAARAAQVRRQELRRVIHSRLLRYLVAVGEVAGKRRGGLAEQFKLPRTNCSNQAFLTAVDGLLARAEEQRPLLLEKGMVPTLLDDIRTQLSAMQSEWEAAKKGLMSQVGASAELEEIASDVTGLVKVLDGLNQLRFQNDRDGLAAWNLARHVPVSRREVRGPGSGEGVIAPTKGDIAPAA